MNKPPDQKRYDLVERTLQFAKRARAFVKKLPRTLANIESIKQCVQASGSVGANYIEANEALRKNDFRMYIKISRKEMKENGLWLKRVDPGEDPGLETERGDLTQESIEFASIFGSILRWNE